MAIKKALCAVLAVITIACIVTGCTKNEEQKPRFTESSYEKLMRYDHALSYNEWNELFEVVMSEAGGEPYEGQQAIANCILNKCRITGKRPSQVISEDHYSHWCSTYTKSVEDAVISVFKYGEHPVGRYATLFYAPSRMKNRTSEYHEKQNFVCEIGGHRFYAETNLIDSNSKFNFDRNNVVKNLQEKGFMENVVHN